MAGMATTNDARAVSRPLGLRGGRTSLAVLSAVALLIIVSFLSLSYGAISLSPREVWSGLFDAQAGLAEPDARFARNVVWQIRYPRLLDAMVVGAALAVAGTLLQGVTRNPLADPTILGVTAAAGLASATALVLSPTIPPWGLTMACVGGGLLGGALLFVIAWRGTVSPIRLALSGVALSAFFGAVIVGLLSSSRTFVQTSLGFLAGGLYASEWEDLRAAVPYFVPALIGAYLLSGRLNVLALGDDVAAGLGVLTDRTRVAVLAAAGILTGVAVAVAGLVSFVGLVCPHIARLTVGTDNRVLLPVAALYGATLVAAADLFARLVISPSEIPFGIITAGLGAPFLLYLVRVRG
jgi:iron complex transport system permease protein